MPHRRWKTTTFVGALTLRDFIAPWVLNGLINNDAFETYADNVVIPKWRKGDIVVMDPRSSHKCSRLRLLIEVAGAQLRYPRLIVRTSTPSRTPSPR